MQVIYWNPDEFGNLQPNELFRGQSQGFAQGNQNQANVNQGGNNQGGGKFQGNSNNQNGNNEGQPRRRGRGFASMDPQRVSEIASMGGKAAHAQGVAHEWTPDEARRAGRKGGQASRGNRGPANQQEQRAGGGGF